MLHRRTACRTAARLSAAIHVPVQALCEPLESRRLLNAGQLDAAFANGGVFVGASVDGGGIVVQSTGKTVAVGIDASGHAVLERFNADGSLDPLFGNGGKVTSTFSINGFGDDLALAAGDKLVFGGGSTVARFDADGSVDTSFGGGTGYVNLPEPIDSVAVQTDGKIVTGGYTIPGNSSPQVAEFQRVNVDGTLDNGFGSSGVVNLPTAINRVIDGVVVESTGKIAGVGLSLASPTAGPQTLVIELNSNGTVDGTTFASMPGEFSGVAESKGGGLVAVGGGTQALIASYATTGPDAGQTLFVDEINDGIAGNTNVQLPQFDKVVVQVDGKIVAAGNSNPINRGTYAVRVDAAGNIDRTFGDYGATYVHPNNLFDSVKGLALAPDGGARLSVNGFQLGGGLAAPTSDLEVIAFDADGPAPGDHIVPQTPSDLTLTPVNNATAQGVILSFREASTDETGFAIERATHANGPYSLVADIPGSGTGTFTFTDATVSSNEQYYYRVSAFNYGYASAPGTPQGVVSPDTNQANPGGVPNAPFALALNTVNGGSATLDFYDSSNNETGFIVQRGASANGPFSTLQELPAVDGTGNFIVFSDSAVSPGATYFYRVYAINGQCASSITAPVSATIPGAAETPYLGQAAQIPGTVQAENYDNGGEGVAYHDAEPANLGGKYRNDGVDIESTPAGGYAVDFTRVGEYLKYSVASSSSQPYDLKLRMANVGAGAFVSVSVDGGVVNSAVAVPNTGSFTTYADVDVGNVIFTPGAHVIEIYFSTPTQYGFVGNLDSFAFTPTEIAPPGGVPFGGTPFGVGQLVQAENFNTGGEGVAYHDADAANLGGQYRPTEGVDIEATGDFGGGYDVGFIHPGEYLNYTGTFAVSGKYDFTARLASPMGGGTYHVDVDGKPATGEISIANSGSFQTYYNSFASGLSITAGTHVVEIVFDSQPSNGFVGNLNWFELTPSSAAGEQPDGAPASLPDVVQAELFDLGGEGVAFHDADAANLGGAARPEGVDIESLGGKNFAVDYTHAGEWLQYTVDATAAGTYAFSARVANAAAGGAFHVEIDGVDVTGTLAVPNTGSFTTFADVTKSGIALTPGQHVIRFAWDANNQYGFAGNLDSFKFS